MVVWIWNFPQSAHDRYLERRLSFAPSKAFASGKPFAQQSGSCLLVAIERPQDKQPAAGRNDEFRNIVAKIKQEATSTVTPSQHSSTLNRLIAELQKLDSIDRLASNHLRASPAANRQAFNPEYPYGRRFQAALDLANQQRRVTRLCGLYLQEFRTSRHRGASASTRSLIKNLIDLIDTRFKRLSIPNPVAPPSDPLPLG